MALIPMIDHLLKCDEANVREMRAFLDRESSDILEAIDRRSKHYGWANRAFGQGVREHFR